MLQYSLTGSERSRDTICSTLGYRKESIDEPDLGDHRFIRSYSLFVTLDRYLYRLGNHHGEFLFLPLLIGDDSNCAVGGIDTFFNDGIHCPYTGKSKRNEDLMGEHKLLDATDGISTSNFIPLLYRWSEIPFLIRYCFQINTTLKEESALFSKLWKWVLKSIEDLSQKTRSQFNRQ